jgi:hypothetical protein
MSTFTVKGIHGNTISLDTNHITSYTIRSGDGHIEIHTIEGNVHFAIAGEYDKIFQAMNAPR